MHWPAQILEEVRGDSLQVSGGHLPMDLDFGLLTSRTSREVSDALSHPRMVLCLAALVS